MRRQVGEGVALVALRAAPGVGDVLGGRLVAYFGSATAALRAPARSLGEAGFSPTVAAALAAVDLDGAAAEVARVHAAGARVVGHGDPEYPPPLCQLADAPLYLVARGEPLADGPAVAVVGARQATLYGREAAARLAQELAQAGVTIVSGLARGVDAAAHIGALRGEGHTVGVLGCGIDVIYPAEHAALAERIAATGTLLSERPVGAPPLPAHFPARNRIIAGMTHGTLVIEAAEHSGSLITARLALEQGREVFALPGRIDSPLSVGTHQLIQQGAKLTATVEDILSEIAPALRARAAACVGSQRRSDRMDASLAGEVLVPLLAGGPLAIDALIRASGLSASQVMARVLDLELAGIVVQLPGQQVQLASR